MNKKAKLGILIGIAAGIGLAVLAKNFSGDNYSLIIVTAAMVLSLLALVIQKIKSDKNPMTEEELIELKQNAYYIKGSKQGKIAITVGITAVIVSAISLLWIMLSERYDSALSIIPILLIVAAMIMILVSVIIAIVSTVTLSKVKCTKLTPISGKLIIGYAACSIILMAAAFFLKFS